MGKATLGTHLLYSRNEAWNQSPRLEVAPAPYCVPLQLTLPVKHIRIDRSRIRSTTKFATVNQTESCVSH